MFGKLKDKLKSALSVFSKKAEEEADVEEIEVEKELPIVEKVVAKKVDAVKDKKVESFSKKKEEKKQESKILLSRSEQKVQVDEKNVVSGSSIAPVKKNLLAQQMEHFAKLKEAEKKKEEVKAVTLNVEEKQIVNEKNIENEKVITHVNIVEEQKVISQKEEFTDSEEEEGEFEVPAPINAKEESKGFFGKLKKTFTFKKEEDTKESKEDKEELTTEKKEESEEEDFADVDSDVVEEKVLPKKVEVKQPIILKKKVVVEDDSENEDQEVKEEKKGLFGKIKEKVTSRTISEGKFEELFWDLELALLENNVSVEVIEKIKVDLKEELVDKPLPWDVSEKIHKTLTKTLKEILSFESQELVERIAAKKKKPYVIAFFGINGTGKTTSIAKLTYHLQEQGYSVVLAACDTFRAAAIQQLGEHAQRLGVKMIQHNYGSDAAAVAFDAVQYAEKNKLDVVLIDTAGRLHSNTNLMAELDKIIRVVKPDMKIFVGESITGNDCIEQARQFNSLVSMDGAILTKVDVDEKGGAPLSIAYTIKKPILFLGVGQEYKDLEKFEAETILGRLGL